MTQREKLVELVEDSINKWDFYLYHFDDERLYDDESEEKKKSFEEFISDYLLENGVIVLPCKVGDTVYKLCTVNSRIKIGDMWDGRMVKSNCDRCGYKGCGCYNIGLRKHNCDTMVDVIEERTIKSLESIIKIMPYFGIIWFATKEEAEKALAERKANEE